MQQTNMNTGTTLCEMQKITLQAIGIGAPRVIIGRKSTIRSLGIVVNGGLQSEAGDLITRG